MAIGDDDSAPKRFVTMDLEARREWLAQPDVRRVMVSIAYYKLGLRRDDAEELIQDFHADKGRRVAGAYSPDRDDIALVRTSFYRYGLNWIRKRKEERPGRLFSFDDPDQVIRLSVATAVAPFPDHLERDERIGVLRRGMDRLSETEHRLIDLSHFRRMPHKEIANTLGTTVGAVKVAIHRAKAELRALVVDEGFCLCLQDISDWPGFGRRLAASIDAPNTAVGAFCALLPDQSRDSIGQVSNLGTARRRLLGGLNRVLRSADLDTTLVLPPESAAANEFVKKSPIRRVHRNRLIVECIFDPHILKAAHVAVQQ